MIKRLGKLAPAQVWLLSSVVSFVVTECIVGGVDLLLNGTLTYDYLVTGFVMSLPVAALAGGLLSQALRQYDADDAGQHIPAAALKTPESPLPVPAQAIAEAEARHPAPPLPLKHATAGAQPHEAGGHELKLAVGKLEALPAMPIIAQKLLALRLDTDEGERTLLLLVEQDPQISAKLLGLANSVTVGASRQIRSVKDAAMLLGTKRVQSVAASIAIISLMAKTPSGEFDVHDLWLHSFRVAFAMQGIARFMPEALRPDADQIFLVGMLHDIGYLALAYIDPNRSDRLHNYLSARPDHPSLEIEREILGICHDELGAELARHWNLPEEIIAVLRYHHSPDTPEATPGQPLVRMINIAEKLLPAFGIIEYVVPAISDDEWAALGIAPEREDEVRELVEEKAEDAVKFVNSFA